MSFVRLKEGPDGDNPGVIHLNDASGKDFTLCGYALEGEAQGNEDGGVIEVARGRIDCPACASIVRFAKTIPARALKEDPRP